MTNEKTSRDSTEKSKEERNLKTICLPFTQDFGLCYQSQKKQQGFELRNGDRETAKCRKRERKENFGSHEHYKKD